MSFVEGKGFGFVKRDDGEDDLFMHFSQLKNGGVQDMLIGMKVSFDVEPDQRSGKSRATNVTIIVPGSNGGLVSGVSQAARVEPATVVGDSNTPEPDKEERRGIPDSDGGGTYTFSELRTAFPEYSDSDLQGYWRDVCKPVATRPTAQTQLVQPQPQMVTSYRDEANGSNLLDRHADTTASSKPTSANAGFREWLMGVDASGALLVYLEALEENFDTVAQFLKSYTLKSGDIQMVDKQLFDDIGVTSSGHRQLFEKWFEGCDSHASASAAGVDLPHGIRADAPRTSDDTRRAEQMAADQAGALRQLPLADAADHGEAVRHMADAEVAHRREQDKACDVLAITHGNNALDRHADTTASSKPTSANTGFRDWLMGVDASGALLVYLEVLEENFDTVAQLLKTYTFKSGGNQMLDKQLFDDIGVTSSGHRQLFEKWFEGCDSYASASAADSVDLPHGIRAAAPRTSDDTRWAEKMAADQAGALRQLPQADVADHGEAVRHMAAAEVAHRPEQDKACDVLAITHTPAEAVDTYVPTTHGMSTGSCARLAVVTSTPFHYASTSDLLVLVPTMWQASYLARNEVGIVHRTGVQLFLEQSPRGEAILRIRGPPHAVALACYLVQKLMWLYELFSRAV